MPVALDVACVSHLTLHLCTCHKDWHQELAPKAGLSCAVWQILDRGLDAEEEAMRVGDLARPDAFLAGIKELLAGELAAEPCLRQIVRIELYQ